VKLKFELKTSNIMLSQNLIRKDQFNYIIKANRLHEMVKQNYHFSIVNTLTLVLYTQLTHEIF
jgi:hypothetical protein